MTCTSRVRPMWVYMANMAPAKYAIHCRRYKLKVQPSPPALSPKPASIHHNCRSLRMHMLRPAGLTRAPPPCACIAGMPSWRSSVPSASPQWRGGLKPGWSVRVAASKRAAGEPLGHFGYAVLRCPAAVRALHCFGVVIVIQHHHSTHG